MHVDDVLRRAEVAHRRGAFDALVELVDAVPTEERSIRLEALRAIGRLASTDGRPSIIELTELFERARDEDPSSLPLVGHALASEQRLVGDPGVVTTCASVLAPVLDLEPVAAEDLAAAVRRRWPNPAERLSIAELLRISGQIAMLVEAVGGADVGLTRIDAAIELAAERGSVASERAWLAYIEVLLFRRRPLDVLLDVRAHAMELWRAGHQNAALRIGELAVLHYYAGRYDDARLWIGRARDAAAEQGTDLALLPLEALTVTLDVIDDPGDDDLLDEFEARIARLLDHPHLAPFHRVFASQFGLLLLDQGRVDGARRFAELGERSPTRFGADAFSLATHHLHARLLALDDLDAGVAALEAQRDAAAAAGRAQLVRLIERDLIPLRPPAESDRTATTLAIQTLAPTLSVCRGDGPPDPVRGQPAHLLALIIASGGAVAVDVVMEAIWPNVDPDIGRNRLHGVLLRLRRVLGIDPSGPLRCEHDVIELVADRRIRCDVWELAPNDLQCEAPRFLNEQFPYDDRIEAFRRAPIRRL